MLFFLNARAGCVDDYNYKILAISLSVCVSLCARALISSTRVENSIQAISHGGGHLNEISITITMSFVKFSGGRALLAYIYMYTLTLKSAV